VPKANHPYSSVVRVYATTQEWDYDAPWQADTPSNGTGSGVVIAPGRVLTGAHVVADATFLQVQKVSDPDKFVARVEAIWHDCDLALLAVDAPEFMDEMPVAELGELPELRDHVAVVGYPVGGDEISVTEGVVSRIELQEYRHSHRDLLAVTIDAAINDGNSGGPVYKDGKVIGIAFQTLSDAENIGEIVPVPIVRRFLEGVRRGVPAGVPGLGLRVQGLENPSMRAKLGLGTELSGVSVVSTEFGNSVSEAFEVGDAILSLDGMPIANNQTVSYAGRFRTRFSVFLGDHFVGEEVGARILRDGAEREVRFELTPLRRLVPCSQYDQRPRYFVYGGLVIQPLSQNYLATWNRWRENAPAEFLDAYYSGRRTAERREVIVVSQVLADEINVGYEDLYSQSVRLVDGVAPRDLSHLVELIEGSEGLVEMRTTKGVAVFDTQAATAASQRILERYRIPEDRYLG
jgi:S1-C subfamily serine protease